ncbi:Talin-1 [Boothiomyces sp. JEL0866]|nr:Talin-1 [Boothiomyces sp. JEL0866]
MSVSLKIYLVDLGSVKTCQYSNDMYIIDICKDIRQKFNYGEGGLDHGLLFKEQGIWLTPNKMLGHYDLKYGDTLDFRKKHRVLKVKTLDESIKNILVDESTTVKSITEVICNKIGLANPEEYSLMREEQHDANPKKEKEKKKGKEANIKSDAQGWLNPDKTLREQGMTEEDYVILKKKFFVTDQNVDRSDPVQLVMMYTQAYEMVISGKHPCTPEEAAQFGGIEMQIKFGNQDPERHKVGFVKMKDFLPPEYVKNKEVEKAVYREHSMLKGTTELNAKFRYVQLMRSLKSYGTSFFVVKEPADKAKKKKAETILLGVTKNSIIRMNTETKQVLTDWKLTHLRRWAATAKSFTLDFGDYADTYYQVETEEGEEISRLIAGYIDILIKRRNLLTTTTNTSNVEEQAVVEDYVRPGRANNVAVVSNQAVARQAKVGGAKEVDVGYSSAMETKKTYGQVGANLETIENQNKIVGQIKNAMALMGQFSKDLANPVASLPPSKDPSTLSWRNDTRDINSEALASQLCMMLSGISAMLMEANGNIDKMNYEAIGSKISYIVSSSGQATQSLRNLGGLTTDDLVQDDLNSAGKNIMDATVALLHELIPIVSGHLSLTDLHSAASKVAVLCSNLLEKIDHLDVSEINQSELLNAAAEVGNAVSNLAMVGKKVANMVSPDMKENMLGDIKESTDTAALLSGVTVTIAPVILDPLSREQLFESAIFMRDRANTIQNYSENIQDKDLVQLLQKAIMDTEDALAFLVEKARNVDYNIDFEIESYHEQIQNSCLDIENNIDTREELFAAAKDLTVNGTRMVEVLKIKASQLPNEVESLKLQDLAKELSELIAKMVASTKTVISNPNSANAKQELISTVDEIKAKDMLICTPYLRANMVQHLLRAFRGTISGANHVISTSRQTAASNNDRGSQIQLNKAGQTVVEKIPKSIKSMRDMKGNPNDYILRFKLIHTAKEFIAPSDNLITASDIAINSVVDPVGKEQLHNHTRQLAQELDNLKHLLGDAEQMFDEEELQAAMETLRTPVNTTFEPVESELSMEEGEKSINDHAKSFIHSVGQIVDAIEINDTFGARLGVTDSVSELQQIEKLLQLFISGTDDPDLKSDLLQASSKIKFSLANLIDGVARNDSGNMANDLTNVKEAMQQVLDNLPMQRVINETLGNIKQMSSNFKSMETVSVKTATGNSTDMGKTEIQSLLLMAASDLTSATQALVKGAKSDVATLMKKVEALESSYGKLVKVTGNIQDAELQKSVSTLGGECDNFLKTLKSSIMDAENIGYHYQLVSAAKSVGETVDEMLGAFSDDKTGFEDCNKSKQILNEAAITIAEANQFPKAKVSYGEAKQTAETSVEKINDLIFKLSKSSDPAEISAQVLALSDVVQQLITNSVQATQVLNNTDLTSEPAQPSLINQEAINKKIEQLRKALPRAGYPDRSPKDILEDASLIANNAGALCLICKETGTQKAVPKEVQGQFNILAKNMSGNSTVLVKKMKELAQNPQDEQLLNELASIVKNIGDQLVKVEAIANSTAVSGQPAKPSAKSLEIQTPVLNSCNQILNESQKITVLAQSGCTNGFDEDLKKELLAHIESICKSSGNILGVLSTNTPGKVECDTSIKQIEKGNATVNDIEKMLVTKESVPLNTTDLQSVVASLQTLLDTTSYISTSKNDPHDLVQLTQEIPSKYDGVIKNINGALAVLKEETQLPIVQNLKDLGNKLVQLVEYVNEELADPNDLVIYQLESEIAETAALIQQITAAVKDSEAKNPEYKKAVEKTEKLITNIETVIEKAALQKPLAETIVEINSSGGEIVDTLLNVINNQNTESFISASKTVTDQYEATLARTAAIIHECNDEDLKTKLKSLVTDLGGSVIKAVDGLKQSGAKGVLETNAKSKLNQTVKEITAKQVEISEAVNQYASGIAACKKTTTAIDGLLTELDTNLLFAKAGELNAFNANNVESFSSHKEALIESTQKLTKVFKTFATANQLSQDALGVLVNTAETSLKELVTTSTQAAVAISSADHEMQFQLLSNAKNIGAAMKDLITATINTSGASTGTPARTLIENVEKNEPVIIDLVDFVKTMDNRSKKDTVIFQNVINSIEDAVNVLTNKDPALGSALPAEVTSLANQLVQAGSELVGIVDKGPEEMVAPLNNIKKLVEDICRAGKAVVVNAPADKELETISSVAFASRCCVQLIQTIEVAIDNGTIAGLKDKLAPNMKFLNQAVAAVNNASGKLVAAGYVDPNDPNIIAERELLAAAASIEAAAKKLTSLQPTQNPNVPTEELNFEDQIVEVAKAIAVATSALVKSATGVQREIIAKGRAAPPEEKMYYSDGTWTDGLVSAAKNVVLATNDLCEAANSFVKGKDPLEKVIVCAKGVSATTVQLLSAAAARSNNTSSGVQIRLKAAGKAVTDATEQLVKASKGSKKEPAEEKIETDVPVNSHKNKILEMEAQMKILKLEKELEVARAELAAIRKGKYIAKTNPALRPEQSKVLSPRTNADPATIASLNKTQPYGSKLAGLKSKRDFSGAAFKSIPNSIQKSGSSSQL